MTAATARRAASILLVVELILLALFAYGYYRWAIEWRLNGVHTTGEVIDKQTSADGVYWVEYNYTAGDTVYTRQHSVTVSFYESTTVGQTVEVIYSPIDSSVSGIPGQGGGDYDLPRLPGTFFDLRFLALVLPPLIIINLVTILVLMIYARWVSSKLTSPAPDVSTT